MQIKIKIQKRLKATSYVETLIGLVIISGVLLFLLSTATYYIKVATNLQAKDYMQNTATIYGRLIQALLTNTDDIDYQKGLWQSISNTSTNFKIILDSNTKRLTIAPTNAILTDDNQIETTDDDLKLREQLAIFSQSNLINNDFLEYLNSQSKWTDKLAVIIQKQSVNISTNNIIKLKITVACLKNACRFKPIVMYHYIYNPVPEPDSISDYGHPGITPTSEVTPTPTPTPTPTDTEGPTPTDTPTPTPTRITGGGGPGGGDDITDPTPIETDQ